MAVEEVYRKRFDDDQLKRWSRLNPVLSILVIMIEWLLIFGAIWLYVLLDSQLLIPFIIFWVGSRMYAFYSLIHEGCHYLIHSNRKVNDWIANVFLAWPLFIDVKDMRFVHFLHHKHLQSESDPEMKHLQYEEFQFPIKRNKLILICIKDLSGYNFLKYKIIHLKRLLDVFQMSPYRMIYYLSLITILTKFGVWHYVFLFWMIPYMTVYQLLNRIRLYTEHFNLEIKNSSVNTRTLNIPIWQSFFLAPYGLGFHAEHHLYPYIPFYRLRKLHGQLMVDKKYESSVKLENNYSGLLKSIFGYEAS